MLSDSEDSEEEFPVEADTSDLQARAQLAPRMPQASTSSGGGDKGKGQGKTSAKRKLIDDDNISVCSQVSVKKNRSELAQVLEGRSEIYERIFSRMDAPADPLSKLSNNALWARLLATKVDAMDPAEAEEFKFEVDGMALERMRAARQRKS